MESTASLLIVDDSRIFRGAIESAVAGQPGIQVVGSVFSGEKALEILRRQSVDLVTLDVEMPGLGGLATLQEIEQLNRGRSPDRTTGVVMVSAFTRRGADVTMQALQSGAFDFVTKPVATSPEQSIAQLQQELLPRFRLFLMRRGRKSGTLPVWEKTTAAGPLQPLVTTTTGRQVQAILIAASTGGPKALATLLPELVAKVVAPVLIVQHMPAEFTRSLAEHLGRLLPVPVVEAEPGQVIGERAVWIAKGGRHLELRRNSRGQLITELNDQPPESGCRPSASVLFRSAAGALGANALAIVLTGMGSDGTAGLQALHQAGAFVIAQDEESSVVWGMPGSAVHAGVVHAIHPIDRIAAAVAAIAVKRGPA